MKRFANAAFVLPSLVLASALVTYACSSEEDPADPGSTPTPPRDDDAGTTTPPTDAGGPGTLDGDVPVDAGSVNPIANVGDAGVITPDGFGFGDGPVVVGDVLHFSDVTSSVIVKFAPPDTFTQVRTAAQIAPRYPIGSTFDAKTGVILTAESEPGTATPTNRISRWYPDGGSATPDQVTFDGGAPAWDSPNDLVVRPSDGTIYVTDPGYQTSSAVKKNQILRIAPGGGTTVEKDYAGGDEPNGIALSPDATTLYVSLTATGKVVKFPVAADGKLGAEAPFADAAGSPDGLNVDEAGNVYVATATGVSVFAPSGTLWGTVPAPNATAIAFGGPDKKVMYVTANGAVYVVPGLAVAGLSQ